ENWHAGVGTVAVSLAEPMIASGSQDGRVLLWDSQTGAFLRELAFPGGMPGFSSIRGLSFSPDGRRLLTASEYEGCQIYEVNTGREWYAGKLADKPLYNGLKGVDVDPVEHVRCNRGATHSRDGRLIAAGYNSTINLIDPQTSKATKTLQSTGSAVHGVGIAANGDAIAWGHTTDTSAESEYRLTKLSRRLSLPSDARSLGVIEQISSDACAAPRDNDFLRANRKHGSLSIDFKRVKDNKFLVNTHFLEISNGDNVQAQIKFGDADIPSNTPFTFTPDGQTVIVGRIPEIQAYDLTGRLRASFIGHEGQVRALAVSSDGRF